MIRPLLTILALLVPGCGSSPRTPARPSQYLDPALAERYDLYHSLAPRGWAVEGSCDALLFVSLGEPGPLEEASPSPGRWLRRPTIAGCSSDISRDMFMGLFLYIWKFQRLDLALDIWDYGRAHNWKMGRETKDVENRTILLPSTIGLLASLIYSLGGPDYPERHIPAVWNVEPGYVSHLTLLHIMLRGRIHGGLTEQELDTLRAIRRHMSLNPLVHALIHRYTDGDQSEATRLLLEIWPADRLPTKADWSEPWRLQRSDGDTGFGPGSGDHVHPGGDFLLAAAIVLGRI